MSARLQRIAQLADSILDYCNEISDAWADYEDPGDVTKAEAREHRQECEDRIEASLGDLLTDAKELESLR